MADGDNAVGALIAGAPFSGAGAVEHNGILTALGDQIIGDLAPGVAAGDGVAVAVSTESDHVAVSGHAHSGAAEAAVRVVVIRSGNVLAVLDDEAHAAHSRLQIGGVPAVGDHRIAVLVNGEIPVAVGPLIGLAVHDQDAGGLARTHVVGIADDDADDLVVGIQVRMFIKICLGAGCLLRQRHHAPVDSSAVASQICGQVTGVAGHHLNGIRAAQVDLAEEVDVLILAGIIICCDLMLYRTGGELGLDIGNEYSSVSDIVGRTYSEYGGRKARQHRNRKQPAQSALEKAMFSHVNLQ